SSVTESNHQRRRRALPVIAFAIVAFAAGAIVGANHHGSSATDALTDAFVRAWTHEDYASMYSDLDAPSQRATSVSEFADAYRQALRTSTTTEVRIAGKTRGLSGASV